MGRRIRSEISRKRDGSLKGRLYLPQGQSLPPACRKRGLVRVGRGPRRLQARIARLPARGGERDGGSQGGSGFSPFPEKPRCASRGAFHVPASPRLSIWRCGPGEESQRVAWNAQSAHLSPSLATGAHTRWARPRDASRSLRCPPERLLISADAGLLPSAASGNASQSSPSAPFCAFSGFPFRPHRLQRLSSTGAAFFIATSVFGEPLLSGRAYSEKACRVSQGSLRLRFYAGPSGYSRR